MKLVTVATHSERYYPYLQLSCKRYGHELITLGWGEKWQGFAWRFKLMKDYLQSLNPEEIVCFIDAFDVVILQTPEEIEEKFIKLINGDLTKVLISKEKYSHNGIENTIIYYFQNIVFTKCKTDYINAGTYIGSASTLLNLYTNICNEFKCKSDTDDQRLIQDYCNNHNEQFIIDSDSSLFLVINSMISKMKKDENDISFNNNKLIYKKNIYPSIFHCNGFTNFDYIIEKLGYDPEIFKAEHESKSKFIISRFFEYLPLIIQRLWVYIVIIILSIYLFIKYYIYKKFKFKKYK